MSKKDQFKNELMMRMRFHLDKTTLSILYNTLNDMLYHVDIVDTITLPATMDNTNEYILGLYELKRGLNLKESSLKTYIDCAKNFINFMNNKPLTMITTEDIEYYLETRRKEGNQNNSLNNKRRKLNSLFVWMKKNKFIRENPMDNIDCFKTVQKPVDHLTALEVEQLKTGCINKRDRALLEWFRCTAMRVGEIPQVNINSIDWTTGQVRIYGHKTDTYRLVMLDAIALKYLKEYVVEERKLTTGSDKPLFVPSKGNQNTPLTRDGIYSEVKRIAAKSGLNKRVYPHIFRKTCATNIVKRGASVDEAGLYLGHKPNNVTAKHYAYMSEDSVKRIFKSYVECV